MLLPQKALVPSFLLKTLVFYGAECDFKCSNICFHPHIQ